MDEKQKWPARLADHLGRAISDSRSGSVQMTLFVESVYEKEKEPGRAILAKRQIRRDTCIQLRKLHARDEQPLIPELLDGYAIIHNEAVHMSYLPREVIMHRRNRLQLRIFTMTAMVAAYDEMLSHDLPLSGEAA